jgi:hypothetical protein
MLTLWGDVQVSLWTVLLITFVTGLLGGAVAVAFRQTGESFEIPVPNTIGFVLIVGAALPVSGGGGVQQPDGHPSGGHPTTGSRGPLTGPDHRSAVCGCAVIEQIF